MERKCGVLVCLFSAVDSLHRSLHHLEAYLSLAKTCTCPLLCKGHLCYSLQRELLSAFFCLTGKNCYLKIEDLCLPFCHGDFCRWAQVGCWRKSRTFSLCVLKVMAVWGPCALFCSPPSINAFINWVCICLKHTSLYSHVACSVNCLVIWWLWPDNAQLEVTEVRVRPASLNVRATFSLTVEARSEVSSIAAGQSCRSWWTWASLLVKLSLFEVKAIVLQNQAVCIWFLVLQMDVKNHKHNSLKVVSF